MDAGDPPCPKRMVYGPCGGVRPDGTCEMRPGACTFPNPVERADAVAGVALSTVPRVLTDMSAPPYDPAAVERICEILVPASDALLVGEHHNRPDYPPTLLAQMLRQHGARPWMTLACRDRNRVVLEQELQGLAQLGVDTVLCVTGDGRGPDVRPEVMQVFDLDGPRLAELAAATGLCAAVPEAPLAPPAHFRARRAVTKQRSGASVVVLNHLARPADVGAFVRQARDAGLTIPVIAAVAVYTDERSAQALRGLPGLALDEDVVDAVLRAPDPLRRGVEVACEEARRLLEIDGVEGVNLSGLASGRGWELGAQVKADIGTRLRAEAA